MRRAHKVDSNQAEIVKALRDCGCSVAVTSALGGGFPDLVVGLHGLNFLFEVKASAKDKLTHDEELFCRKWRGKMHVVTNGDDALTIVAEMIDERRKDRDQAERWRAIKKAIDG